MAIGINIEELYKILEMTPARQNVMLVGKHGIGKSRIIEDYYTKRNLPVVALFLGQMSDPGDLIGLPRLNEKTGKTDFMPPYWFPTDGKPIVLFLDELNRARPEMLQTVMDLVLNRKLAGKSLPEGSRILSAVNAGEEYQVGDLDPALVSRFNIYELRPTAKDWLKWAKEEKLDERVINFISLKPTMLDSKFDANNDSLNPTPDRRAWERVARALEGVKEINGHVTKMIAGMVGVKAAAEFMESCRKKRLSGKDILTKYEKVKDELNDLELTELTLIIDDMLSLIQDSVEFKFTKQHGKNLDAFSEDLLQSCKRETYVYLLHSLLNGKNSAKGLAKIAKTNPDLLVKYSSFIQSL